MDYLLDLFLHLDKHLNELAGELGGWFYLLLFVIVFCETGLVVTPFLPGDSLLFAVGALAAVEDSRLSLWVLAVLLSAAAIAGDAVNYAIGYRIGLRVSRTRLLNQKHLVRTQLFYERHGGKTIVLARFIPIIRTFAPFVAGIGKMRYGRFALFNVTGGIAWVALILLCGYQFGELPFIKGNFQFVILAIIVISLLPLLFEYVRARRETRPQESPTREEGS